MDLTTGAVCGELLCPAAVQVQEQVDMEMHQGIMCLEYTSN